MSSTPDFDWLIDKWLRATEAEQGLIRLHSGDEVDRIRRLASRRGVSVQIETLPVARSRSGGQSQPAVRARILCVDAEGRVIKRSAGPVRWVMSWGETLSGVSVIYLARNGLTVCGSVSLNAGLLLPRERMPLGGAAPLRPVAPMISLIGELSGNDDGAKAVATSNPHNRRTM